MNLTQEELKYLEDAKVHLTRLCEFYHLPLINLKIDDNKLLGLTGVALFKSDENTIYLNKFCLKGSYDKKVSHEFRHYWQREHYPSVYNWWLVEHKNLYETMKKTADEYHVQLSHKHCPLELDAILFGNENGNSDREDLLIQFQTGLENGIDYTSYYERILKTEGAHIIL